MLTDLAAALGTTEEHVRRALEASADHGRSHWTDVGGLRVAWRQRDGRDEIVLERYLVLPCAPRDLLEVR